MTKIDQVISKMNSSPEQITGVEKFGNELFFYFKHHIFSIISRSKPAPGFSKYTLYLYPGWNGSLVALSKTQETGYFSEEGGAMIPFDSQEHNEKLMAQLYSTIEAKLYNVDQVFDDILNGP